MGRTIGIISWMTKGRLPERNDLLPREQTCKWKSLRIFIAVNHVSGARSENTRGPRIGRPKSATNIHDLVQLAYLFIGSVFSSVKRGA